MDTPEDSGTHRETDTLPEHLRASQKFKDMKNREETKKKDKFELDLRYLYRPMSHRVTLKGDKTYHAAIVRLNDEGEQVKEIFRANRNKPDGIKSTINIIEEKIGPWGEKPYKDSTTLV